MKVKTSIFIEQNAWREFRAECIKRGLKPSDELKTLIEGWLKKR